MIAGEGYWTAGSTLPASFYSAKTKMGGEGEFAPAKDDVDLAFAGREDALRMPERRSENVEAAQAARDAGEEADDLVGDRDESDAEPEESAAVNAGNGVCSRGGARERLARDTQG